MRFYDTAQKGLVEFVPKGSTVTLYVCGITPYDSAHLGHIFTFMIYDLLQRRLEDQGSAVRLVRNITDVDEPLFAKARALGMDWCELAARETAAFQQVMQSLNFRAAFGEPRASEYIGPMADAVAELLEAGYAYQVDHDIYFDTGRCSGFGQFSGFNHRLQLGLLQLRGGDPERPGKRHPLDFLLWKSVPEEGGVAAWDSPVGRGRPGWHLECTVMSEALVGTPFDIHGGGSDLVFPHHECEVVQSQALHGALPARYWLHVAPLLLAGEKMSKSLGNLVFAKDLLGRYEPAVIRLSLLHYHYRSGGQWRPELLDRSVALVDHLRHVRGRLGSAAVERAAQRVRQCLDNDLDTPAAVRELELLAHRAPTDGSGTPEAAALLTGTLGLLGMEL